MDYADFVTDERGEYRKVSVQLLHCQIPPASRAFVGGLRAVVCGNELFVAVSLAKVGLFELGF